MFSLRNFRSYQLSLNLYSQCETIKARAHLRDQLLRASLSVCLNLSDGSAKPSTKERLRFYTIALASIRETQTLLSLIPASPITRELADQTGACIYRLINPQNACPQIQPQKPESSRA